MTKRIQVRRRQARRALTVGMLLLALAMMNAIALQGVLSGVKEADQHAAATPNLPVTLPDVIR